MGRTPPPQARDKDEDDKGENRSKTRTGNNIIKRAKKFGENRSGAHCLVALGTIMPPSSARNADNVLRAHSHPRQRYRFQHPKMNAMRERALLFLE